MSASCKSSRSLDLGCLLRCRTILAATLLSTRLAQTFAASSSAHDCSQGRFEAPSKPGAVATEHNGKALRDVCMLENASRHIFIIGDWGGVRYEENMNIMPADHRSHLFPSHHRDFVDAVDDCAQQRVAGQMQSWAAVLRPDYVLNVGDNFYWGGVNGQCGRNPFEEGFQWSQWGPIFEDMYKGPGLDGVQWLGILGNHDYGGFVFTSAWDETLRYTWGFGTNRLHTGRWLTPAQYWQVKVWYTDFSIDYYFVDTNVYNTWDSDQQLNHNICSSLHNTNTSECEQTGPTSLANCRDWFSQLWATERSWLKSRLSKSTSDWQILVSHFPPEYDAKFWRSLADEYGIDLMISGHRHYQQLMGAWDSENMVPGLAWIISGGGGGITSDKVPEKYGQDDAYGFMDLEVSKTKILATAVSHGGHVRKKAEIVPRPARENVQVV
eukprot:gb/GFBE01005487.1/.p1 GENE.gb/GFBE01005487.1/~~gb/GFBE01005487.1/.p1  ORF type:complete len:438 (+),score=83.68 gb/GFBE01005487.1/:1-1314(+)